MATLNISIPDEMRAWIDSQVESGRYANASDYLRDLIRENLTRHELIKLALIEGEKSGESTLSIKDIIQSEQSSSNKWTIDSRIRPYWIYETFIATLLNNFGQLQAEAYLSGLDETLVQVSNTPTLAQKVDDIRKGYRRYLYQEHAVYFIEKKSFIYVVRVLHQQMKASLHLG